MLLQVTTVVPSAGTDIDIVSGLPHNEQAMDRADYDANVTHTSDGCRNLEIVHYYGQSLFLSYNLIYIQGK